jgi:tetratricopeptide (TPR) repeat protein
LVGAALLAAALASALAAAVRVRRAAAAPLTQGLAAVGLAAFAYWALHSSGDWLWSLPAISAPVFAWLGMAASLGRRRETESVGGQGAPPRGPIGRFAIAGAMALASAFAAISFGLPWASARYVDSATDIWRVQPDEAFSRLERARDLNFLSPQPDLRAGTIAVALNDREQAGQAFADALERESSNWYATLQLGTLDLLEGRTEGGRARLRRAAELNPRDSLIGTAQRRAERGNPLTMQEIDRRLLRRICSIVGTTEETRFCG